MKNKENKVNFEEYNILGNVINDGWGQSTENQNGGFKIISKITGENKNHYLNKLTHFDLRQKKFPVSTMAQTLIARIECCVYHLKDKYLVSCHSSYEDYIKARLQDNINL